MGNSDSTESMKQFHPKLNKPKKITQPHQSYIEAEVYTDERTYASWKLNPTPDPQEHRHLLLPVKDANTQKCGFCSNRTNVNLTYADFPHTLNHAIENKRLHNQKFKQEQIWNLMYGLLKSKEQMSKAIGRESRLGDIQPINVFLDSQGKKIAVANKFSWPGFQDGYSKVVEGQAAYLAPQHIQKLRDTNNNLNSVRKKKQAEYFSIGLTLLSCGIVQNNIDLYGTSTPSFNHNQLVKRITYWLEQKQYSQELRITVANLCQINPQKRLSGEEMGYWMNVNEGNIDDNQIPSYQIPNKVKNDSSWLKSKHPYDGIQGKSTYGNQRNNPYLSLNESQPLRSLPQDYRHSNEVDYVRDVEDNSSNTMGNPKTIHRGRSSSRQKYNQYVKKESIKTHNQLLSPNNQQRDLRMNQTSSIDFDSKSRALDFKKQQNQPSLQNQRDSNSNFHYSKIEKMLPPRSPTAQSKALNDPNVLNRQHYTQSGVIVHTKPPKVKPQIEQSNININTKLPPRPISKQQQAPINIQTSPRHSSQQYQQDSINFQSPKYNSQHQQPQTYTIKKGIQQDYPPRNSSQHIQPQQYIRSGSQQKNQHYPVNPMRDSQQQRQGGNIMRKNSQEKILDSKIRQQRPLSYVVKNAPEEKAVNYPPVAIKESKIKSEQYNQEQKNLQQKRPQTYVTKNVPEEKAVNYPPVAIKESKIKSEQYNQEQKNLQQKRPQTYVTKNVPEEKAVNYPPVAIKESKIKSEQYNQEQKNLQQKRPQTYVTKNVPEEKAVNYPPVAIKESKIKSEQYNQEQKNLQQKRPQTYVTKNVPEEKTVNYPPVAIKESKIKPESVNKRKNSQEKTQIYPKDPIKISQKQYQPEETIMRSGSQQKRQYYSQHSVKETQQKPEEYANKNNPQAKTQQYNQNDSKNLQRPQTYVLKNGPQEKLLNYQKVSIKQSQQKPDQMVMRSGSYYPQSQKKKYQENSSEKNGRQAGYHNRDSRTDNHPTNISHTQNGKQIIESKTIDYQSIHKPTRTDSSKFDANNRESLEEDPLKDIKFDRDGNPIIESHYFREENRRNQGQGFAQSQTKSKGLNVVSSNKNIVKTQQHPQKVIIQTRTIRTSTQTPQKYMNLKAGIHQLKLSQNQTNRRETIILTKEYPIKETRMGGSRVSEHELDTVSFNPSKIDGNIIDQANADQKQLLIDKEIEKNNLLIQEEEIKLKQLEEKEWIQKQVRENKVRELKILKERQELQGKQKEEKQKKQKEEKQEKEKKQKEEKQDKQKTQNELREKKKQRLNQYRIDKQKKERQQQEKKEIEQKQKKQKQIKQNEENQLKRKQLQTEEVQLSKKQMVQTGQKKQEHNFKDGKKMDDLIKKQSQKIEINIQLIPSEPQDNQDKEKINMRQTKTYKIKQQMEASNVSNASKSHKKIQRSKQKEGTEFKRTKNLEKHLQVDDGLKIKYMHVERNSDESSHITAVKFIKDPLEEGSERERKDLTNIAIENIETKSVRSHHQGGGQGGSKVEDKKFQSELVSVTTEKQKTTSERFQTKSPIKYKQTQKVSEEKANFKKSEVTNNQQQKKQETSRLSYSNMNNIDDLMGFGKPKPRQSPQKKPQKASPAQLRVQNDKFIDQVKKTTKIVDQKKNKQTLKVSEEKTNLKRSEVTNNQQKTKNVEQNKQPSRLSYSNMNNIDDLMGFGKPKPRQSPQKNPQKVSPAQVRIQNDKFIDQVKKTNKIVNQMKQSKK